MLNDFKTFTANRLIYNANYISLIQSLCRPSCCRPFSVFFLYSWVFWRPIAHSTWWFWFFQPLTCGCAQSTQFCFWTGYPCWPGKTCGTYSKVITDVCRSSWPPCTFSIVFSKLFVCASTAPWRAFLTREYLFFYPCRYDGLFSSPPGFFWLWI